MDMDTLIADGYIRKIAPSPAMAAKEFKEAKYDLEGAKKAEQEGDSKWATVKAYYSMFHAAKGILFLLGFQEKGHFAIGIVLDTLVKQGKLESNFSDDFSAALSAREGADCHYSYSKERASQLVQIASEFLERMEKLKSSFK